MKFPVRLSPVQTATRRPHSKMASVCVVALLAISTQMGCKHDNRALTSFRLNHLWMVVLYSTQQTLQYPDLSTPRIARNSLDSGLRALQTDPMYGVMQPDIFIDPISGQPFIPNPALSHVYLSKIKSSFNTILFYAPQPLGDERAVLFADGHISWIKEAQWPMYKTKMGP